jgi:hypothetical protein
MSYLGETLYFESASAYYLSKEVPVYGREWGPVRKTFYKGSIKDW